MKKNALVVLFALAVLAAAACQGSPTGPSRDFGPNRNSLAQVIHKDITTDAGDYVGTWQATKVEAWNASSPDSRRDLVAEGGTVTLVLEADKTYTITVTMPGAQPGVDNGLWYYSTYSGRPQIDFYPASIPDPEYGQIPAFLVDLSGNTLKLWDSGMTFLPFDFGWEPSQTCLILDFTR